MPDPGQKNFRLPPWLADDLDQLMGALNKHKLKVKTSQMATAAFLAFFERKPQDRITLIQRARSPDFEKLRRPKPISDQELERLLAAQDLDCVVEAVHPPPTAVGTQDESEAASRSPHVTPQRKTKGKK